MNVTFIENAFNEYETKEMVLFQSCLGLDAKDKVSLLSKAEAEKYFPTDGARSCLVSSYARNMIGDTTNYWTGDDMAGWWLLPDGNDGSRWIVNADGSIVSKSGKIFVPLYVRPVIRINIKK